MKRHIDETFTSLASKRLKTPEDYDKFELFAKESLDLDTIKDHLDGETFGEPHKSRFLIDAIFDGLLLNQRKIVDQVFNHILNVINKQDIQEKSKELVLGHLSTYIYKLTTNELLELVERCYEDIKSCKKNNIQSWVYLMPGVLKNISETSVLLWEGKFYPGHLYKTIVINDLLCSVKKINVDVIVPIAMMFRKALLTESEATKVIKCLCIILSNMTPSDVPLVLNHMLYIGTSKDTLYILVALQKYFDLRNGPTPDDNIFEAECNVLFILEDYSKMNPCFVNCVLKYIEMCKRAPDKVLRNFLMAFLLAISNCRTYENDVLKHLRELVFQSYFDDELINRSFWLKGMFSKNDCEQIFKCLINNNKMLSYKGVVNGLIKLALSLLNTRRIVNKNDKEIVEKFHRLGTFILISVLEKKQYSYITTYVLKTLTESSFQSTSTLTQYLDCLHVLCKSQYANLIKNNSELLRLIRGMPLGQTHKVLHATKLVFKSSATVKDNIIIQLRKELQSKDLLVRCSAINGLIEILRSVFMDDFNTINHFIENENFLPGLFTQVTLCNFKNDNYSKDFPRDTEELCLEIINLLKICLRQNAIIKTLFYRGLLKVSVNNLNVERALTSIILDHLRSYLNYHKHNGKISLKFDKALTFNIDGPKIVVNITEPLDDIIVLIQNVFLNMLAYKSGNSELFKNILDPLVDFYGECNFDEINVNENETLYDIILKWQYDYVQAVNLILCTYQGLIVFSMNYRRWHSENYEFDKLQKLIKNYNKIIDSIKHAEKRIKCKNDKSSDYKFEEPIILLNFESLFNCLSLLVFDYTDWNTSGRVTLPSGEMIEPWCFVLRLIRNYLSFVEDQLKNNEIPPNLYENLCNLTNLLYSLFLFDFRKGLWCFGDLVVNQVLECYVKILSIVCSNGVYLKDLDTFISDCHAQSVIHGPQVELLNVLDHTVSHLDFLINCDQLKNAKLLETIERQLIRCISMIGCSIRNDSPKLKNVLTKLMRVAKQHSFVDKNNANQFLITTLKLCSAFENREDNMNVLAGLAKSFCILIKPIDDNIECLKLKTVFHQSAILMELCKCLREEFKYISYSLCRLEAEKKVMTTAAVCPQKQNKIFVREHLENFETIICQTMQAMSIANYFIRSEIPLGQLTEFLFETICDLMNLINSIVKLFHDCSTAEHPAYKNTSLIQLFTRYNEDIIPNISKLIIFVEYKRPLTKKERASAKFKVDTRRQITYIPKLVKILEVVYNSTIDLSKKCKDEELLSKMRLTSCRDYKLSLPSILEVLNKQQSLQEE